MKLTIEITITPKHIRTIVFNKDKSQIGSISENLSSYTELDKHFKMLAQVISVLQRFQIPNDKEKQ